MINKNDISTAIAVLNHKMSILSREFRTDAGGWKCEGAYIKWHFFKKARDQLRR